MRDDLPPRSSFRLGADDDRPLELRAFHSDPVQPPERVSPWRIALIGGVGAAVLGVAVAVAIPGGKEAQRAAAGPEANFRTIQARYTPPDRERIARAHADVDRLVAEEGLAAAARASMSCFEKLARQPEYGLMDYCLALDAYGAAAYARAAGEAAPPSTYFGQGSVRRQKAVQMLTAGQTDANSRLIDTNRLIEQIALQASIPAAPVPAVAAVTIAPTAPVPEPGPAPVIPPPKETVKVFRPPAEPPLVAQAAPEPAVKVIRVKAPPPPAPAPKPVKPVKPAKAVKPAPAPKPIAAKAPAKSVKAPKAMIAQAKAAPAKPSAAKTKAPKPVLAKAAPAKPRALAAAPPAKPRSQAAPPDSGPWFSKLEAVLKRPVEAAPPPPAKPAPGPEAKAAAPPAPAAPKPAEPVRTTVSTERAPEAVRPSFDCRSAMSRGQQLVCREPALAAADRRLSVAFNQALHETDNPRGLIAEQNRWLAMRDRLAPNVPAVMNLYQDRIAELRRLAY